MLYAYCSLWLCDVIQRHRSESTLSLPQVMARCHYVNQSWLFIGIGKVLCHSLESFCTHSAQATPLYNDLENYPLKVFATFTWGQWVKRTTLHLGMTSIRVICVAHNITLGLAISGFVPNCCLPRYKCQSTSSQLAYQLIGHGGILFIMYLSTSISPLSWYCSACSQNLKHETEILSFWQNFPH